jgi:Glycosyltransferase family 87
VVSGLGVHLASSRNASELLIDHLRERTGTSEVPNRSQGHLLDRFNCSVFHYMPRFTTMSLMTVHDGHENRARVRTTPGLSAGFLFHLALPVILLSPLVVVVYWPAAGGLDVTGHQIGRDFINVWVGPQLAFGGQLATLFDLHAYHAAIGVLFGQPLPFHNWGYPLFTLLAFWPLAQLPYFVAFAVWTVGLFAVFAGVTLSQVEHPRRASALLALILAPACLINTISGQNGFLSAVLMLGGILSIDRRPILAGLLFGLLTFKPHLCVVVPFALLALAAWRVIATASVTALVLVFLSIAVFGIEPWRQYIEVTSAYQLLLLERFRGFYTYMMVSGVAGARTFGLTYPVALVLQVAMAMPVLGAAIWALRLTTDACRRAFVLVSATPLVTPYAFNYDLTALTAVLVWMLCRTPRDELVRGLLLFLGWMTPARGLVLFLGWVIPILAIYLNELGLGLAPLALAAVFALSVCDAVNARSEIGRRVSPAGQDLSR